MNRSLKLLLIALLSSIPVLAAAQTKLERQLSYVDLGVQGVGEFTRTVTGPITIPAPDTGTVVSQSASNTLGALVTLRYSPRPYMGAEVNIGYARYTEGFNVNPLAIQTQSNELTFGYLVIPPYTIFGVKPYASGGVGVIRFAPTAGGGQGAPTEARPGFYYNVGVQQDVLGDRFGIRVGFRQLFFTAPDFYQNYITVNKHTVTSEPMIGFYLHF